MRWLSYFLCISFLFLPKTHTVEPIIIGCIASGVISAAGTFAASWWFTDPNIQRNIELQGEMLQNAINKQKEDELKAKALLRAEVDFLMCIKNRKKRKEAIGDIPEECTALADFYIAVGGAQAYQNILKNI
jgi:hypothetical protein